jgi:chromosome segregation ATPase
MSNLRSEYAQQSTAPGGMVLSEREEHLSQQVQQLLQDLQEAKSTLELANKAGKEALHQASSSNKPYAQIARELVDVNAMLHRKNKEMSELQASHDRKSSEYAQEQLRMAQRIDQATAEDRNEIHRLSNDLAGSERKIAALQQQVVSLQTLSYDLKRKHAQEVQQMNSVLREKENYLMQIRTELEAERNNMNRQKQMLATEREAMKSDMDFKFNQMRDSLNQNYAEKLRQLKDSMESNRMALDQERKSLIISQRQAQDVASQIARDRNEIDRYRRAYDIKMAEFFTQKQTLDTALASAQAQSAQFAQIEDDYKKRINILRQSVDIQRQRFEAQISELTTKLAETAENRNMIANSLEKCSAARDGVIRRVDILTDENTRLKDMFLQVKTRMDLMRTQYEAHAEKMRAEAGSMQTDLRNCAQRLQDATLVHDHVKRMKEEAVQLRANLEEQIRAAKGNEQALRRLLHDRELEKQQVIRLQEALKDCGIQRKQTEAGLMSTNEELRDMKRMQSQLTGEIGAISTEYQQALRQNESTIAREELQQKVREQALLRQLSVAKSQSYDSANQVKRLQNQRKILSETLADTAFNNARQIQSLSDAQNVTLPKVLSGTGKSGLVNI